MFGLAQVMRKEANLETIAERKSKGRTETVETGPRKRGSTVFDFFQPKTTSARKWSSRMLAAIALHLSAVCHFVRVRELRVRPNML